MKALDPSVRRIAETMARNGIYIIQDSRTPGGTVRYRIFTTEDTEPDQRDPYQPKHQLVFATKAVCMLTGDKFNHKHITLDTQWGSAGEIANDLTRALKAYGIMPEDAPRVPYQEV